MRTTIIGRTQHLNFAVRPPPTDHGGKLNTMRNKAGAFVIQISDQSGLHPNYFKPHQNGGKPSTNNRFLTPPEKTLDHFLLFDTPPQQLKRPPVDPARSSAILHNEKPLLSPNVPKVSICAKPTNRCRVSFRILLPSIHITKRFLDTGARVNFTGKTLIHLCGRTASSKYSYQNKEQKQSNLCPLNARYYLKLVMIFSVSESVSPSFQTQLSAIS